MHTIHILSLLLVTTSVLGALPPTTPSLSKRVFRCAIGALVCCRTTVLEKMHVAEGCAYPACRTKLKTATDIVCLTGTFVSSAFEATACKSEDGGLACCEEVVSGTPFHHLHMHDSTFSRMWRQKIMGLGGRLISGAL